MNNLELTVSFIVGGLLLLILLGFFTFYSNFYNSKTINEINTVSTMSVEEIIDYDFSKIGYRAGANPITSFDSTFITFNSDLDNNGNVETVYYFFDNGLTRLINPGQKSYTIPNVKNFYLIAYDSSNTRTNIASEINSIELKLSLNSENQLNDTTFFATSYFEEIYYLRN